MSEYAVDIQNLTKGYGTKKALDNISLKIKKGEVMGFLGPNGAGKSTTMNIICGYLAPSSGNVFVDGLNTAENPMETKRKIGYLPEIPPLYTDMTVEEYLDFVYDLKGAKGDKEKHLRSVMKKVRVFEVKGRLIRNLSKGYRQRVGLAQALIGDPDVLILDEPTVGLDPGQILEIREVISELGRERTVILSTHILQEVMAVCDSYTIINNGRIVASGNMSEFTGRGTNLCRIRVKGDADRALDVAKSVKAVAGVSVMGTFEEGAVDLMVTPCDGNDIREELFNAFAENRCPVILMSASGKSLEQTFMQAISGAQDTKATKEEAGR